MPEPQSFPVPTSLPPGFRPPADVGAFPVPTSRPRGYRDPWEGTGVHASAPTSPGASSSDGGASLGNEAAEAHPVAPRDWGAVVVSVSGSTAVVTIGDDTESTTVPVEVAGVVAGNNVIVTFGDKGRVALSAIVQT